MKKKICILIICAVLLSALTVFIVSSANKPENEPAVTDVAGNTEDTPKTEAQNTPVKEKELLIDGKTLDLEVYWERKADKSDYTLQDIYDECWDICEKYEEVYLPGNYFAEMFVSVAFQDKKPIWQNDEAKSQNGYNLVGDRDMILTVSETRDKNEFRYNVQAVFISSLWSGFKERVCYTDWECLTNPNYNRLPAGNFVYVSDYPTDEYKTLSEYLSAVRKNKAKAATEMYYIDYKYYGITEFNDQQMVPPNIIEDFYKASAARFE